MLKFAAAFMAVFLCAQSAHAQQICGPREKIVSRLKDKYQEAPAGEGLANGILVELFVSASGSWTIIKTRADGLTCLMAVGQDWEPIKLDPEEEA